MAQAPLRVALEMREHSETRVDRRASKHATRSGVGQGVEAKWSSKASGARVEASRGVEHYTLMSPRWWLQLTNKQTHRIEPDMTPTHTHPMASPEGARQPNRAKRGREHG